VRRRRRRNELDERAGGLILLGVHEGTRRASWERFVGFEIL
jgi:hypothetical protein